MARGWSLRARFVLVAVSCLVPLLGVVLFVLYESINNGRDQLLDAQSATAEVVANVVATTLDENEKVLTELASIERVRRLEGGQAGDVLEQFKRARPNLYGLFLLDGDGRAVAAAGLDPTQFRTVPSFSAAVERALTLGEPGVSNKLRAPDAEVIALVAPVRAKNEDQEQPIGAAGALLSVDRLKDAVLPFARGDSVIGLAAEGELIAAQGANLQESDLRGRLAEPVAQAVAGAVGRHTYRDETGAERLAAYAPVPGADWAVLVIHPSPTTYAPNRMLVERGLAALGLAVVATLLLVLLLGEWIARPLRQLTAQAAALARGDFGVRVTPAGGGEVAALGVAFREMADQLTTQVRDLEAARESGAAWAERMRELNRRTVRLQEDERRRIAGEIHDAVAPLITGALYQARALRLGANGHAAAVPHPDAAAGANGAAAPGDGVAAGLDAISDLLARATEELHGVIFALRPPDLDDIGVVAAIERYMEQVRRAGLNCRIEPVGEQPTLTPEVRLAIYRIVQEALHNALRHGAADEAVVRLEAIDDALRVTIRDNGSGFNPEVAQRPTALGLLSMRERAAAIGATFAVASRPGDGTTITIERRTEPEPEPHAVPETAVAEVVVVPERTDEVIQA